VIIRRATLADLDLVAPLYDAYRQFYAQRADLAAARAFIGDRIGRGESTVFLALEDDGSKALGFTQLYPAFCSVAAKPYYVLYDLYVASGARRRGVAKRLMERAREFAAEAGAFRLELQTARNNTAAQALYESLGWVRDEQYFVYTLKTG
jgi:ribosomal protein S18 acetylase RimI-like enzyme